MQRTPKDVLNLLNFTENKKTVPCDYEGNILIRLRDKFANIQLTMSISRYIRLSSVNCTKRYLFNRKTRGEDKDRERKSGRMKERTLRLSSTRTKSGRIRYLFRIDRG